MTLFRRLRAYFLTGLIVTAPIGITVWLAWWFVSFFDSRIKPLLPAAYNPDNYVHFSVPGVGLVFAVIGITMVGALAANLVGRTLINMWERFFNRMPVLRSIYKGVKQIFETALSEGGSNFKQVGLIEYPRRGVHVVVFVARELDSGEIGLKPGKTLISAFMPTTPNPTSGFLFFLEPHEVTILDLSVEDGAKLVISAGLVTPKELHKGEKVPVLDPKVAEELLGQKAKPSRRPKAEQPRRARKDKADT